MPKKAKSVSNQQCGDCVHHWACATWNVGSIASMDGTNCANFERFDVKAALLVRCGECINRFNWNNGCGVCRITGLNMNDTDFCSYGERKETEHEAIN